MNEHDPTPHPAQARAQAALEAAEAKARAAAAKAEAKTNEMIDRQGRIKTEAAYAPALARLENAAKEYIQKHLPLTEVFHEAVSIRAYLKAERRDFGPGQAGADWLEAEQDVLDLPPFGEPTDSPQRDGF